MLNKDSGTNFNPDNLDGLNNDQLLALLRELQPRLDIFNPDEALKRQISRIQSRLAKQKLREKKVSRPPKHAGIRELENKLRASYVASNPNSQSFLADWDAPSSQPLPSSHSRLQSQAAFPFPMANKSLTPSQVELLVELITKLVQITGAVNPPPNLAALQISLLNLLVRYYQPNIVVPLLQTWLANQPLKAALDLLELADVKEVFTSHAELAGIPSWRLVTTRKVTDWLAAKLNTLGQSGFVTIIEQARRAAKKHVPLKPEYLLPLLEELQNRWLAVTEDSQLAGEVAELIGANYLANPARKLAGYKVCSGSAKASSQLDHSPLPILFDTIEQWLAAQVQKGKESDKPATAGAVVQFVSPHPARLREILGRLSPLAFGYFLLHTRFGYTYLPTTHLARQPLMSILKPKVVKGATNATTSDPFSFRFGEFDPSSEDTGASMSVAIQEAILRLLTQLLDKHPILSPDALDMVLASVFTAFISAPTPIKPTTPQNITKTDFTELNLKIMPELSLNTLSEFIWSSFDNFVTDLAQERKARLASPAYPYLPLPLPLPPGITPDSPHYRQLQFRQEWEQDLWQLPIELDLQPLANMLQAELNRMHPALERWLAQWIVKILATATRKQVTHDFDPPWDSSGQLTETDPTQILVLEDYSRVRDLFKEYSGQSKATYESGWGIAHTSFAEELEEAVRLSWLGGRCYYQVLARLEQENPVYFRQVWDYLRYTARNSPLPDLETSLSGAGASSDEDETDQAQLAVSPAVQFLYGEIIEEVDEVSELFMEVEYSLPEALLNLEIYPLLVKYKQFAALPVFCSRRKLVACGFSSLTAEWEQYCYDAAVLTYYRPPKSSEAAQLSLPSEASQSKLELTNRLAQTAFKVDLNRVAVEITPTANLATSEVVEAEPALTESESGAYIHPASYVKYRLYG